MGIKHEAVKASGDKGLASEWNANHVVDGDVDIDKHSWKKQVIENLASAPAGPVQGQVYYDTTLNEIRCWNGTAWEAASGVFIKADGSVDFTDSQSMGNHKLMDLTDPSDPTDAANKEYVDGKTDDGKAWAVRYDCGNVLSGSATHVEYRGLILPGTAQAGVITIETPEEDTKNVGVTTTGIYNDGVSFYYWNDSGKTLHMHVNIIVWCT